jgi:predicted CoA-binding protein
MTEALHAAAGADWQRNLVEDDAGLRAVLDGVRRIAVVGIKDERRTYEPAHYIARYLQEVGYEVAGVNPGITQTLGIAVQPAIPDLDPPAELLDVFRRAENIPAHADEVLALPPERRPKVFWMQLGIRHDEAARRLAQAGILVVQDRCILVEHRRLVARAART